MEMFEEFFFSFTLCFSFLTLAPLGPAGPEAPESPAGPCLNNDNNRSDDRKDGAAEMNY